VIVGMAVIFAGTASALAASKSDKTSDKRDLPAVCKDLDDKGDKSKSKKSKSASAKKSAPADDDEDDDSDGSDDDEGIRFDFAGACGKLTGSVSYTYQQARQTGARLPVFVNRNGTVTSASSSNTLSASMGLESVRKTAVGNFKTTFQAEWSKATGDETVMGSGDVSGWSVGLDNKLGELTVGYTGSLISFWEGDFLTTANSPGRAANTIVYAREIAEHHTLSLGLESDLPTTPDQNTGIKSFEFNNPVYSLRWRYETDDVTGQAAGVVRHVDYSASPLLPLFAGTAAERTGWAGSLGLTLPAEFIHEDDEFSFQATYAVDAVSYLGLNNDLTVYQNQLRAAGPATGWSAVGSFHHVWSDEYESNIFASYITVKADLLAADPESKTFRSAINLFWKPKDKLKLGFELGVVDIDIDPHGVPGFFRGANGRAYTGTFSISAEL
jgi:hypothetical protein